jgi:tetratricopeptide (TPR) repeat protein
MDVETLRQQARELANAGRLADAHKVYSMLYDDTRQRRGKAHPVTLRLLNDLATVELRQGRFEVAQQSAERAARGRAETLGAEDPDTLRSWFLVGAVLHDAGRNDEARSVFDQLLPVFDRVFGRSGRETQELAGELAQLVRATGDEELAGQLENRHQPRYDHRAPDTWSLTTALGVQAAENGRLGEAVEILRGVVDNGPSPAATAAAFPLGQVLLQQGEVAAGLTALRYATAGDDPVVTATAWARIGLALEDGGDAGGGAEAYLKAMAGPPGDPATRSAIRLGAIRRDQNDLDAAEQAYRFALDSEDPEHRAIAQIGVAETCWARGDTATAAQAYEIVVRTAPAPLAEHARLALRQLEGR